MMIPCEHSVLWVFRQVEHLDGMLDALLSPMLEAVCSFLAGMWDRELGALELCPAYLRIRQHCRP